MLVVDAFGSLDYIVAGIVDCCIVSCSKVQIVASDFLADMLVLGTGLDKLVLEVEIDRFVLERVVLDSAVLDDSAEAAECMSDSECNLDID